MAKPLNYVADWHLQTETTKWHLWGVGQCFYITSVHFFKTMKN